jgi:hypothetical protein
MYIPLTFEGSQAKCLYAEAGPGGYNGSFISGSDQYNYHLYTGSVGTLNVNAGTIDNVTILIVGGGGGGGTHTIGAQGGGGGEVKFLTNQRLYTGTYSISIGGGGIGFVGATSRIGNTGGQSSFSGSNLFISASGGGGGGYYGNSSGTGVSGNGFAGGTPISTAGGGGGGATAAGSPGTTSSGGNGGQGLYFATANSNIAWGFGCGGGGSKNGNNAGVSCNDNFYGAGANYSSGQSGADGMPGYGMGGGGGYASSATGGGDGSSGVIYIQYKINSYCKNNFNQTGSCGCREIVITPNNTPSELDPTYTGSYVYVPCYGTELVSGSIRDEYPITVCAMSGTFFYTPTQIGFVTGSIGNALAECSTGSSCLPIPQYTSSCSSSIYTYFGAGNTYYVPRNSTSLSFASVGGTGEGNTFGRYICQSSILTNPSGSDVVVQQNSYFGSFIDGKLSGAKCVVLGFTRTIATAGSTYTQTLHYWDQFGVEQTVTKTYNNASPTWTYSFTTSFANGAPYFTSTTISPNELYYLSTANEYTSSGLPTCGCP